MQFTLSELKEAMDYDRLLKIVCAVVTKSGGKIEVTNKELDAAGDITIRIEPRGADVVVIFTPVGGK